MEWLKELVKEYIEEEKVSEFVEKFNKENPKHFMPKDKYNEVAEELKIKRTQLEENTTLINGLKEKSASVEEYEAKLAKLQTDYTELESKSQAEVATITKKTQLKELLLDSKMHKDAIDLFINSTDLNKLEMVEGKLANATEFISKAKTERAGLFIETTEESDVKDQNKENTDVEDTSRLRQAMGL